MAGTPHFLTSKVARRIFVLFVACALVPITALAIVSFGQVSGQLYEHAEQRLEGTARTVGQGIAERLLLLEAELRIAADGAPPQGLPAPGPEDAVSGDTVAGSNPFAVDRFLGITRYGVDRAMLERGDPVARPRLDDPQRQQLANGRTLLLAEPTPGAPPTILLVRAPQTPSGPDDIFVASVNPRYLWAGGEDSLPRNNQLCVFDDLANPLFCTRPADGVLPATVIDAIVATGSGTLEWSLDDDDYLAAYWSIPLAYQFLVPRWTVLLSESRADVLAPMASFQRIFPLVILLSLWAVLLLSIAQIRRSLVPLERLREGTQKIAARQFDSRVDVTSGDEFEDLADSFNEMAARLGKQFDALATIAEIDRTILSSLDIEKIVTTVLERTSALLPCTALSVTLVSPDQQKVPRTYALRAGPGARPWVETTFLDAADHRRLAEHTDVIELGPADGTPGFLAPLARSGCRNFLVFPMLINGEPSGAIAFGFGDDPTYEADDLRQARQLTDQVAVALSNAHLMEDLDALNWGALTALARTVDAKSPWTAGHSERVTAMGLKIGERLKLAKEELDILHRGGLLHDIGKIGVPAAILDKPAKLTEEEFAVMRRHPEIGANILQPIAAYADVIPIVLQHHERWDGSGYPDGLTGRQIHFYARIFAVADVYDALISDRPYRGGLSVDEVVVTIVAGDGTEFDPEVVEAFLAVMTDEGYGVPAGDARVAGRRTSSAAPA